VLTFCVYHSELAGQAWQADLPYVVAVIRLQYSGVKMVSRVVCDDLTMVRIGLGVRVVFAEVSDQLTLPQFVPWNVDESAAAACQQVTS
jgi:uncharacterized OB-fold protein